MRCKKGQQTMDRGPLDDQQKALAEKFMPLAQKLARPLQLDWPSANDEFESAAMFALIEAAQTYNEGRGVKFGTFARHRILGALRDVQRDQVPRGWRTADPAHLPKVAQLDDKLFLVSRPVNRVASEKVGAELEQRDAFEHWLRSLPTRHAAAMRELYLHERTQFEAAARLGCSQSRLSSLHTEAIQILNGTWASTWDKRRRRRRPAASSTTTRRGEGAIVSKPRPKMRGSRQPRDLN
jgi:RNA polymerase sigma factor (sigma-70 family)